MHKFFVVALVCLVGLTGIACVLDFVAPSNIYTVTSPAGGEVWELGTQELVSWECPECLFTQTEVYACYHGENTSCYIIGRGGAKVGNFTWLVGSHMIPGSYEQFLQFLRPGVYHVKLTGGVYNEGTSANFNIVQ